MPAPAPYDRGRFNRALIANALLDPFNVVLLAVVLIAGILLGSPGLPLPVAAVALPRRRGAHLLRRGRGEQGARARARGAPQAARGGARDAQAAGLRAADRPAASSRRARARRGSATRSRAPSCPTTRSPTRSTASCAAMESTRRARSCCGRRCPTRRRSGVAGAAGAGQAGGRPGQGRAGRRARHAAHDAAADGEAARALLLGDGADPGRARHGALAARLRLGLDASRRSRPSWPPTCGRCASASARARRGWRRRSRPDLARPTVDPAPGDHRRAHAVAVEHDEVGVVAG